jgi:hypothetical protein
MRTILRLIPVLAAALLLGGCVSFVNGSPTATQLDTVGDVEITTVVCAAEGSAGGGKRWEGCDSDDVEGDAPTDPNFEAAAGNAQLLTGYRVPDGTVAPASFLGHPAAGGTSIAFARSPSYESQLEQLYPTPDGHYWAGYLSGPFTHTDSADPAAHRMTISARFGLPKAAGGAPFEGPFAYQQVVGARRISGSSPFDRPVTCGIVVDATVCAYSPLEPDPPVYKMVATRDLGLVPGGGDPAGSPGATVAVPFDARYAGPVTDAAFALTASTTVPGGSATPALTSLTPAANTPVPVNVAVPASAPPGEYAVTLEARLPNGQVRSSTGSLRVVAQADAADRTAPKARAMILGGQTVRSMLKRGLRVRVATSEAGAVTVALRHAGRRLARREARFDGAGAKTVTLKLARKARARRSRLRLLGSKRLKLGLSLVAVDRAGNSAPAKKTLRLARGRG